MDTVTSTLPETNIAPQINNLGTQKESNLPTINFQGLLLLVSGKVYIIYPEQKIPRFHPFQTEELLDLADLEVSGRDGEVLFQKPKSWGSHLGGDDPLVMMFINLAVL